MNSASSFGYLLSPISFLQNVALKTNNGKLASLISEYVKTYSDIIKESEISSINRERLIKIIESFNNIQLPKRLISVLGEIKRKLSKLGGDEDETIIISIKGILKKKEKEKIVKEIEKIFNNNKNITINIDTVATISGTNDVPDDFIIEGMDDDVFTEEQDDFIIEGMDDDTGALYPQISVDNSAHVGFEIVGDDEKTDDEMLEELTKIIQELCDYIKRHIEKYNVSIIFNYKVIDDTINLNFNGFTKVIKMDSIDNIFIVIKILILGLQYSDSKIIQFLSKSDVKMGKPDMASIRINAFKEINNLLDSVVDKDKSSINYSFISGKLIEILSHLMSVEAKETCILNLVKLSRNASLGDKDAIILIDNLKKESPTIIRSLGL